MSAIFEQSGAAPNWIVILGIIAAAVIVGLALRRARQRTRDLTDLAGRMGFSFLGRKWRGPALSPQHKMSLLQRTPGRYSDVMMGSIGGLQVAIFDYTHRHGEGSTTQTMTSFSQDADLPAFELRPEGMLDKIGNALLHSNITFDSNPEFSRRYHLRGPDEMRLRAVFTPGLLTYFEQMPPDKKWHVEASGPTLILYHHRYSVRVSDVPALLNEASEIAKMILAAAGLKPRA